MFARILWALAALVVYVQASGEVVLLHTPDSVIFKGNKEIDQSLLKEIFSASLGFTVKQRATWNGMSITNPFNLPEAVVAVAVEGVDSLGAIKGKKFPLNVDEVEETTWQALSGRLEERDHDNSLVRIYLGDGLDALGQSALGELKPTPIDESSLKALSLKNDEDRKFLDEVQLLRAIAKKVPSAITADSKPDVYWLVVSGLRPVFDIHGKNSAAAKEALTLLNEALHDISKAFMDVYKNQVLIAAFTNDASQVRHTRSTSVRQRRAASDNQTDKDENSKKRENSPDAPIGENDNKDKDREEEAENTLLEIERDELINAAEKDKQKEEKTGDNKPENSDHKNDNTNTNNEEKTGDNSHENSDDKNANTNTNKDTADISPKTSNKGDTNNNSINNNTEILKKDLNLAIKYNENYAVIFNIILWFGIAFFFSLLAICIFIAEMDPGRDSIIYRMTSNRMKKDN